MKYEKIEEIEEIVAQKAKRNGLDAHQREVLRNMLRREMHSDERWGEISNRDYCAADEGMHWSDN